MESLVGKYLALAVLPTLLFLMKICCNLLMKETVYQNQSFVVMTCKG